ncbi:SH3 domain-containing protein [Streptomyces phaeochromogenes]
MKKIRLMTAAASVLLTAGTLVATVPSASAAADACVRPSWSNKSTGVGHAKEGFARVRLGPSSDCAVNIAVGSNYELQYDCWVINSAGNRWTHIRVPSAATGGWVWNGNLDDGGSVADSSKC